MRKTGTDRSRLPRIAYVGGESLSLTHGTGVMFRNHFGGYPRSKIVDINAQRKAPSIFRSVDFEQYWSGTDDWSEKWLRPVSDGIVAGRIPPGTSRVYADKLAFSRYEIDWDALGGPPDLVYSTCYSCAQVAFLHHVYRHLPKKVPIIQHFLDFDTVDHDEMLGLWNELRPNIRVVWALTHQIARSVAKFSHRPVELVQALHQPLGTTSKSDHRDFGPAFRSVLIGNVWTPEAYKALCRLWGSMRTRIPNLGPLEWYGHPRRLEQHGLKAGAKSPAFVDAGYVPDRVLRDRLRTADMAIVAFTGNEREGRTDYAKYSLPSRLADYCVAGLPIVVLSRPGTELARYVKDNRIGIVLDPARPQLSRALLQMFIMDRRQRELYARRARAFAVEEFDLAKYRSGLHERLTSYARDC